MLFSQTLRICPLTFLEDLNEERHGSLGNLLFGTDNWYLFWGRGSQSARSTTLRALDVNTSAEYCVGAPKSEITKINSN